MRLALFPGSFDPFTNGHLDVLRRALRLFDRVEVTVAVHPTKRTLFTPEERCQLIDASIAGLEGASVAAFEGLIVERARARGAVALIRGLRQTTDYNYESQMAFANRRLQPDLETVFMTPSENHLLVSASIVREIHYWGGDVSSFVPPPVLAALERLKIAD